MCVYIYACMAQEVVLASKIFQERFAGLESAFSQVIGTKVLSPG